LRGGAPRKLASLGGRAGCACRVGGVRLAALGTAVRVACFTYSVLTQQLRPARAQRVSSGGSFGSASRGLVALALLLLLALLARARVQLLLHLRR
jgi:hypothetical protein